MKGMKTSIYLDELTLQRIEFAKNHMGYDNMSLSEIIRVMIQDVVPGAVVEPHVHFAFTGWKCPDCGWEYNK